MEKTAMPITKASSESEREMQIFLKRNDDQEEALDGNMEEE